MTVFIAFGLAGLMTYLLRSCMAVYGQQLSDSPRLAQAIGFVAPAVLAAIVASGIFLNSGALTQPGVLELITLGVALGVVHRTGNVGMALFVGLPLFWLGSLLPI